MLEFSSKTPTVDFKLDGEVKHIPVSMGLDEFRGMQDAVKSDDEDATIKWFHGFVVKHAGKEAEAFGDAELTAIMGEWNTARDKIGETTAGEA